jgi:hypothetical protein
MEWLRFFGPPHEALHVLALWLIGRRAVSFTSTYVDIPDDLTTRQYIWVAGLPALVFWGLAGLGALLLINAPTLLQGVGGFVLLSLSTLAGLGTFGDIQLILLRLMEETTKTE